MNSDDFKDCPYCFSKGCSRCGYSCWVTLDDRPATDLLGPTPKLKKELEKAKKKLEKEKKEKK